VTRHVEPQPAAEPAPLDPDRLEAFREDPAPQNAAPDTAPDLTAPDDDAPTTAAGALLAGRYRLGTRIGSDAAAGAEFWRAEDTVLRRDVAATVLRRFGPGTEPGDDGGAARAREVVARALRSGSFEHPGCARLLDVLAPGAPGLPDGVLGAAVAEWVPGRSLADAVSDGMLKPLAAARALQPLASAAAAAHRHGIVLGCDHPQRVRVTYDGRTQLGFALPRPELTPAYDVRGLGAVLYTLLTELWPLSASDAARAGLAPAERGPGGAPVPPSSVRPGVPVELETLVVGTLGGGDDTGRVRTAAAVRSVVDEVVAEADRVVLFPPEHDGVPPEPGDVWQPRDAVRRPPDPRRRRKLLVGLTGLGLCVLGVLGYASAQLGALFGDQNPRIVVGSSVAPAGPRQAGGGGAGDAAVKAVGANVYDDAGDRDNAGRVSRVIDGDPDTGWRTFNYRQQFPALKPGVGVLTSFASPVQLSSLSIDSPSPGTEIEIRSAPALNARLDDTVLLARTTLGDGVTAVSLANSQPVQYVLLWITHLGGGGSDNVTEIREVSFRRVAD
jgi:hypothetical protein